MEKKEERECPHCGHVFPFDFRICSFIVKKSGSKRRGRRKGRNKLPITMIRF